MVDYIVELVAKAPECTAVEMRKRLACLKGHDGRECHG